MMSVIITFLIVIPLAVFIHNMGHTIIVKCFKGKIKKWVLGGGPPIYTTNKFQINRLFFLGSCWQYELGPSISTNKNILILLAGPLTNLLFSGVLYFSKVYRYHDIISEVMVVSLIVGITNLIPFPANFMNSDARKILNIIKNRKISG